MDPHIMGFSYGFNPFQLMHKWINHFLAGPADSPAKRAIVDQVYRKSYDDVAAFNAAYGTAFGSFDDILGATSIQYDASLDPRPDEVVAEGDLIKRDFNRITCLLIAKVHQVAHDRMRHYAPEKLILGYFFKSTKKSSTKTELLIFVTPHLLDDAEMRAMSQKGRIHMEDAGIDLGFGD